MKDLNKLAKYPYLILRDTIMCFNTTKVAKATLIILK